ncbi:DUF938 domain containing protein [Nitzschia inconspicua]|uniref:DUF938 domain containing protein n=1 Tax=Nitzschia inconspicua TaxID=303405 RepID=A0A9K3PTG9_9STRA|nr:DUF938 domain containing protein [Nitzschia inconspicua]
MRQFLPLLWTVNSSNLLFVSQSFATDSHQMHMGIRRLSQTLSSRSMMKLDSPSAQRNKQPIWEVLSNNVLPRLQIPSDNHQTLRVLEVAAGCGVHTEHFALALSDLFGKGSIKWYPTDPTQEFLASIQCYIDDRADVLSDIVAPPMSLTLDSSGIQESATKTELFASSVKSTLDVIICINMIHISPWQATLGLMKLAGETLSEKGCLYCYGPYKIGGTALESNLNFDASLRSRNPSWGVRDIEAVMEAASKEGLELVEKIEMPANNLSLIFQRKR